MRAEENILNTHLEAVKEEAQLIQREGEMITTLERAIMNEEEYDMREYLADARQIAKQVSFFDAVCSFAKSQPLLILEPFASLGRHPWLC